MSQTRFLLYAAPLGCVLLLLEAVEVAEIGGDLFGVLFEIVVERVLILLLQGVGGGDLLVLQLVAGDELGLHRVPFIEVLLGGDVRRAALSRPAFALSARGDL